VALTDPQMVYGHLFDKAAGLKLQDKTNIDKKSLIVVRHVGTRGNVGHKCPHLAAVVI